MEELIRKVNDAFRSRWKTEPEAIGIAPGRINIIGEHVDYTGGFVLPAAIDRHVAAAVRMTGTGRVSAYSLDYRQEASCPVGEYDPTHPAAWFRYVQWGAPILSTTHNERVPASSGVSRGPSPRVFS